MQDPATFMQDGPHLKRWEGCDRRRDSPGEHQWAKYGAGSGTCSLDGEPTPSNQVWYLASIDVVEDAKMAGSRWLLAARFTPLLADSNCVR